MAYSIEMPAEVFPGGNHHGCSHYGLTTFFGGEEHGRCLQITIGAEYVQLTPAQMDELVEAVQFAKDESFASHPRVEY